MHCFKSISGGGASYFSNIIPLLQREFEKNGEGEILFLLGKNLPQFAGGETIPSENIVFIDAHPPTGYRQVLWDRQNLPRIIEEHGADVLFIPYQITALLSPPVRQYLLLSNMEPFLFYRYRYSPSEWVRNAILAAQSFYSLRFSAQKVIAVSNFAREFIEKKFFIPREKLFTVYNGRDLYFESPPPPDELDSSLGRYGLRGKRFFLIVGSMRPYRRCEDAIEALARNRHRWDFDLVIAGDLSKKFYINQLKELAARKNLTDRVHFLGWVGRVELRALYYSALGIIFSTEIEACPVTAIEALTVGVPAIAADNPPLPEIFRDAAIYYRPRAVEELEQRIEELASSSELAESLKKKSRERAKFFSWEESARLTYKFLVES